MKVTLAPGDEPVPMAAIESDLAEEREKRLGQWAVDSEWRLTAAGLDAAGPIIQSMMDFAIGLSIAGGLSEADFLEAVHRMHRAKVGQLDELIKAAK